MLKHTYRFFAWIGLRTTRFMSGHTVGFGRLIRARKHAGDPPAVAYIDIAGTFAARPVIAIVAREG
jgi:hypothetical protein